MTEQQTAVRNTGVLTMLQGIIVERQRLLIREANYLRALVGLPPVRAEKDRAKGDAGTDPGRPRDAPRLPPQGEREVVGRDG